MARSDKNKLNSTLRLNEKAMIVRIKLLTIAIAIFIYLLVDKNKKA